MIKKLLYFEFIKNKNISNFKTIKLVLLVWIVVFVLSFKVYKNVNENLYGIISIYIISIIMIMLQAILYNSIKNIRKDSILIFIKKERYDFINTKVKLKIYKSILLFIIPILVPLMIYLDNKIMIASICLLIIINFYLLNMVIAYTISYFEVISNKSLANKLKYVLGIIVSLLAIFTLHMYLLPKMLNGLLKKEKIILNLYSQNTIIILAIIGVVGGILFLLVSKVLKNNLYVILNPIGINTYNTKNGFSSRLLELKSNSLYNKILIKDICCFIRKRGLDFYVVVFFQIGMLVLSCLTVLQERVSGLMNKIELVVAFYIIFSVTIVILVIVSTFSDINQIKIERECSIINKFNIKVDKFKILIEKSNFIFVITSFSTIITILINFLLDISLNGLIQNILIIFLILSWLRNCSLMAVDIANFGLNQVRIIFFMLVSIVGANITFSAIEFNKQLILKYIAIILLNIIAYYIEFLLIKFSERNEIND